MWVIQGMVQMQGTRMLAVTWTSWRLPSRKLSAWEVQGQLKGPDIPRQLRPRVLELQARLPTLHLPNACGQRQAQHRPELRQQQTACRLAGGLLQLSPKMHLLHATLALQPLPLLTAVLLCPRSLAYQKQQGHQNSLRTQTCTDRAMPRLVLAPGRRLLQHLQQDAILLASRNCLAEVELV